MSFPHRKPEQTLHVTKPLNGPTFDSPTGRSTSSMEKSSLDRELDSVVEAHTRHAKLLIDDIERSLENTRSPPKTWAGLQRAIFPANVNQAVSTTSSQKQQKQPRKLDNEKCTQCRHDKVKCSPQPRIWPVKCQRCASKGFECSPGEVKRRRRREVLRVPLVSEFAGENSQDHTSQDTLKSHVTPIQGQWDHANLTNLVVFIQLLNHERSFLNEADSILKRPILEGHFEPKSRFFDTSRELSAVLPRLTADVRKILRDREYSEKLSMADRIMFANAHAAVGEDFVVPRSCPISEESLDELPLGVRIGYLSGPHCITE